jgi:hypothetical protein
MTGWTTNEKIWFPNQGDVGKWGWVRRNHLPQKILLKAATCQFCDVMCKNRISRHRKWGIGFFWMSQLTYPIIHALAWFVSLSKHDWPCPALSLQLSTHIFKSHSLVIFWMKGLLKNKSIEIVIRRWIVNLYDEHGHRELSTA